MRIVPWFLLSAAVSVAAPAPTKTPTTIPTSALAEAERLREMALQDGTGWKLVESLTTVVGPRLAGSRADARAVKWAEAQLKVLGYDKVWTEPVSFPKWVRHREWGEVLGTHAQALTLTALGGSVGGKVEGEVVRLKDLSALEALPAGALSGKIAFVDFRMQRTREGRDYREGGRLRTRGPSVAIRKGASGFLMRSAGTASHRLPHTGYTRYAAGLKPIPAAALAAPDADQLARLVVLGPTRVRLVLECGYEGTATSYNVLGEVKGSANPDELVLLGAHLDSWDLGTGAIDDAAGVGITMAAGHLIARMKPRPRRSIRVVAFANEEQGLYGGKAYAEAHAHALSKHVIAAESDFGAGRIYGFGGSVPPWAQPAMEQMAQALLPLGIASMPGKGGPGPDLSPFAAKGLAWAWLGQDGTHYFDWHHSPDDTLDKIEPKALAQNVAAYAVFAYLAAQADGGFGSSPRTSAPKED